MSWTILGMLAIANAWTVWKWRSACAASRALARRLDASDFLLEYYRELEAERAMWRENEDYLRVTGGCNCEHQCRDCGRAQVEWYTDDDVWEAFQEAKAEMFDVYERDRTGRESRDEGRPVEEVEESPRRDQW